jgi:calcineurin-like phosphoesterase family protein
MKTFVTSDLHLNHGKIIKHTSRPFKTLEKMNEALVFNWNKTIAPSDKVYFLGDLSYQTEDWIPKLNGDITFIKGNHDTFVSTPAVNWLFIKYDDIEFYLVHDPINIPKIYKGWVIHGHHHNNFPGVFPFFNQKNKMFNVSTEMTNYAPVDMDYIVKSIRRYFYERK